MTPFPWTVFSWGWVSVLQSVSLTVMFLLIVLLRPLPKRNCSCYLCLMTLGILRHRMLHDPFCRSITLDDLYPNIFVDFIPVIVLGNNNKISSITSFRVICTTDSLIRSVASSKPGPSIMNCNINNIFLSEGWLMNMFLSHIFPCTQRNFMHFQQQLCVHEQCKKFSNSSCWCYWFIRVHLIEWETWYLMPWLHTEKNGHALMQLTSDLTVDSRFS